MRLVSLILSSMRWRICRVESGSPEMLLTQLVSDRKLSEAEIRRLRKLLDERLAKAREEG